MSLSQCVEGRFEGTCLGYFYRSCKIYFLHGEMNGGSLYTVLG